MCESGVLGAGVGAPPPSATLLPPAVVTEVLSSLWRSAVQSLGRVGVRIKMSVVSGSVVPVAGLEFSGER